MASKKRINKEQLFLLTTGAVCVAFMAFTTMLFPAVKVTLFFDFPTEVSGLHAIFGGTVIKGQDDIMTYNFNIISLIGFLLPLVSLVLSILAFKKDGIILNIVATMLCLIATIVMFLEPVFFQLVNPIYQDWEVNILFGPVVGGLLSLISGGFNLGCIKLKK